MNKAFHMTAPIIALHYMPKSFVDFFLSEGHTEEQIGKDADLPDMVDKDNLIQNADIHHAHSYKLAEKDGKLHWIDGDALERLKGLCADAHDFKAEGKLDMLRYALGKMTHYRIDALTYPHLHRGAPWSKYHEKFETELGKFITANKDKIVITEFATYDDVYKASRATAIAMWYKASEALDLYEKGETLPDGLKMEICTMCVREVASLWATLAKELKL